MPFNSLDKENAGSLRAESKGGLDPWAGALLVFALAMSLTLWLSQGEQRRAVRAHQEAFEAAAHGIAASIGSQLSDCERLIRTFQSVFLASDEVSEEDFDLVYENLRVELAHINLQALAYAERVERAEGDRYVTTLFVPTRGNESIRGLDVTEQPNNMQALVESADSNLVRMSRPFTLRQSGLRATSVDGFILRLPVYAAGSSPQTVAERRLALVGSMGASFRMNDLLRSVMPSKGGLVSEVRVVDISDQTPRLLHQHGGDSARTSGAQRRAETIRFGGRSWEVTATGAPYDANAVWWSSTFWLGTLVSSLLAALGWSWISTRKRAIALGVAMSERFRASEERFRKLTELLPSLVLVASRDVGALVYENAAARARLGRVAGQRGLSDLFGEESSRVLFEHTKTNHGAVDLEMIPLAGAPFWANICVSAIDIDDEPMWLIVASDVSEQRRMTERLSYQASHDSLTKLLNRREFEARLGKGLAAPGPQEGALLFIDLDQFKLINDTAGHRAGDELLVQLAAMMREKLRPGDILARLGGDEFGVLLSGVANVESASHAAERLRRSLEGYIFSWEQRTYMVSASIGAVMLSKVSTLKEMFAHADTACYMAKEAGRNRVHFYSDDDAAITMRLSEMEWASRIADALREERLLLDYQELRPLQPGVEEPPHIELLLRLRAENGREVMPGAFLPAAERYGLMPAIDRWVVSTALAHLDDLHPSGSGLGICAINLSSSSLEDAGLFQLISDLIIERGINPRRLMFEITETVAMRDFAASSELIARLRGLGCRVALDDFGAGMSSFGYMKNLELDVVKIDGSFVQEITTDRMSQSIVRAVTEICHQQGLQVVAEWVSSPDMVGLLRSMGVDYVQGFALHKPERVLFQRPRAA